MKRTLMAALIVLLVTGTAMAAPRGHRQKGMEGDRGPHGTMIFRLIASVRTDLDLTADQNAKLDQLLNEVKGFMETERDSFQSNRETMMDQFVAEDFDAAAIHANRMKLRDERRDRFESFMVEKIQALHDLLTQEQREELATILEEKRDRMRGNRSGRGLRGGRN